MKVIFQHLIAPEDEVAGMLTLVVMFNMMQVKTVEGPLLVYAEQG